MGELRAALGHLGAGEPRLLGYADERAPSSAPGRPRLVDAPVEDVVAALVPHVRACRPDVVLTHDVHGGLTGHPGDRRVHEVTVRAVREAASGVLHPHAGPPHCPRRLLLATHPHAARAMLHDLVGTRRTVHTVPDDEAVGLDVTEWLPRKVDAIVAHTSEVDCSALPGLVAAMPRETQERLLGREWYTEMSSALSSGPLASGS